MEKSRRQRMKSDKSALRKMPKTGCFVYILAENMEGVPVYVGQTRTALDVRLRNHLKDAVLRAEEKRSLSPVQKWIVNLIDSGSLPVIRMLDDRGIWDVTEAVWIDRYTRRGIDLLNVLARVS